MKRLALLFSVLIILVLAGCSAASQHSAQSAGAPSGGAPAIPAQPGQPAGGGAQPGPGSAVSSSTVGPAAASVLPVPPQTAMQWPPLTPAALRVSPDGRGYALWVVLQGEGLVVWREGDAKSVPLSATAMREFAWTPDGICFVQLTANMDGKPQLMRYRWGEAAPTVLVDSDRLHGTVRALQWSGAGRLFFADDEGMKAASDDGRAVTSLPGAGVPVTARGGVFAPGSSRYVGVQDGKLVLSQAGQAALAPLADLGSLVLQRVAWAPGGDRVAVELAGSGRGLVVLYETPDGGAPREIRREEGVSPVLFADRLAYLAPGGDVMEAGFTGGAARPAGAGGIYDLAGDPARGRLFTISLGKSQVPYFTLR